MMIIHAWNVRGLNSPLKQHEVATLMRKKHIDVFGLFETKMNNTKVTTMHKLRLKQWQFVTNAESSGNARIVVFWNPSTTALDLVASSLQSLHAMITSKVNQSCYAISFVYGLRTVIDRRSL